MTSKTDLVSFMITAGFGARERQPYVEVLIEAANWMTQMSPATARELAANLWEAAERAEGDGFLVTYIQQRVGVVDDRAIAAVLSEFREYREAQRGGDTFGGDV